MKISIGDILVLFSIPALIYQLKINKFIVINSLFFLALSLLVLLIFSVGDIHLGFYRAALYYFLFLLIISSKDINFPCFYKIYGLFSIAASIVVILQWVAYVFFSLSIPIQIPIAFYEPDTLNIIDHVFRSGGLFKEPSYFAIYVAPYMFFTILKQKYLSFFVIALAGVLTTSSLVFFLILICIFFGIKYYLTNLLFSIIFITLVILLIYVVFNSFLSEYVFLERIYAIFLDGGTLNERFMPFIDLLKISNLFFPSVEVLDFYLSSGLWFSSAASIVAYFGILGLMLILFNIIKFQFLLIIFLSILFFSTHFMAGPFCYLIGISILILDNKMKLLTKVIHKIA